MQNGERAHSLGTMRRFVFWIVTLSGAIVLACVVLFVAFYLWFGVARIEGSTISTESVTVVSITPQP
ncbi:hypothetical protein OO015_12870 [Thermomicrobium sp. 4228-Ro]|uniref:hypothetical protein n=1 Tax=Thermomicrobium sp. 4228-Ro TaxID=2993937 RepID=UPI0022491654|nr:hypothetical protein [Thermomicrobium sp. 4228-Ro]MCX2728383.1 hypothetical protein [Thermomicrobium sp. 4228-Ro]